MLGLNLRLSDRRAPPEPHGIGPAHSVSGPSEAGFAAGEAATWAARARRERTFFRAQELLEIGANVVAVAREIEAGQGALRSRLPTG